MLYIPLIEQFSNEDEQRAWTRGREWGGPEEDWQSDSNIEFYETSRKIRYQLRSRKKNLRNTPICTHLIFCLIFFNLSQALFLAQPGQRRKPNHEVWCNSDVIIFYFSRRGCCFHLILDLKAALLIQLMLILLQALSWVPCLWTQGISLM